MAYNYVCTAQKPTSVTHSLTGAFTGECHDQAAGEAGRKRRGDWGLV